jgi:diguanylate cyclase (GGDEF)-like protein
MLAIVFIVATFNLALGFCLAVALAHRPAVWPRRKLAPPEMDAHAAGADGVERPSLVGNSARLPPPAPVVELPADWLNALEQEAVVATSFVEASVQVLRLEVGRYRERLLGIDDELRLAESPIGSAALRSVAETIHEVNAQWLAKQAEATSHLSQRRGTLGEFELAAQELESVLLEQTAQIETTLSNLAGFDIEAETDVARKRLARELGRLIDLAHLLRDRMGESLLAIMAAEGKVGAIDAKFQQDAQTSLLNRFGLEVLFRDWWRDDPARQRLISCIHIDIDRLHKLNEWLGPRRVDALLRGFAQWLDEQVRRERGCDRVVRLTGEAFVVFLGDTGPRNATSAAERIRQTLRVTSFELGEQPLELTASIGVIEVLKRDDSSAALKRLQSAVHHAKQAGRDRTSLDEGAGPKSIDAPHFQVKARVARLD